MDSVGYGSFLPCFYLRILDAVVLYSGDSTVGVFALITCAFACGSVGVGIFVGYIDAFNFGFKLNTSSKALHFCSRFERVGLLWHGRYVLISRLWRLKYRVFRLTHSSLILFCLVFLE